MKTPIQVRKIHSNQRGQVAIFVALIFQIIFVLFAMVVNVGLLVHHKINLQHSTDLSAYYGAMKQADLLNVVAHMNYQIRQSWKLMAWRYRVLGTFGYIPVPSASLMTGTPIQISQNNSILFDPATANAKCAVGANSIGLVDAPPFCVGHSGFGDTNTSVNTWESSCRIKCDQLSGLSATIPSINAGSIPNTNVPGSGNVSEAIRIMLNQANTQGRELCRAGAETNVKQLVNFISAYIVDMENRTQSAQLIMGSLLANADNMLDLDGKKVSEGVKNTLMNNLTEANRSSLGTNYKFFNSSSRDNSAANDCEQRNVSFNELKFQFVDLLVSYCEGSAANMRADQFLSVFNADRSLNTTLAGLFNAQPQVIQTIQNVLNSEFKIGFEKNPWCQNYFGVRATTEPRIPFLPLAKIKLHASAFAKPFGGSIGPWYHKTWFRQEASSSPNSGQTDATMPPLRLSMNANPPITERLKVLPNFSLFIGDELGLKNPNVVAAYHDLLLTRNTSNGTHFASKARLQSQPPFAGSLKKPTTGWPYLTNWDNTTDMAVATYDPLALVNGQANSGLRDLEIAAVAPNQFDLAYYSIEPDFYNNYYKNRLDNPTVVGAFKALSSFSGNVNIRPDLGWNQTLASSGAIPADYSVRHQLAVVEEALRGGENGSGISQLRASGINAASVIERFFTYIPRFQGSLLTGWTFRDMAQPDGYSEFPGDPNRSTMPFGRCKDDFQSSNTPNYQSIVDQGSGVPPTSGNCVTGGRTGYSVKLVSPNFLNYQQQGDIGGTGTADQGIRNPIPPDFFNF